MADLPLSRLFERYRSENDLAALAEVFDRVSPDLLRVARHTAGRGVEPEDLVQGTFLAAIERSSTFDAERPLLPWLLGILVNQSRRPHRRESRSLAEDSESSIPARPDHENDAESHELDAAVTRALDDLPLRYREVLVPHLSEGKDPHVIARELGRPQGTVRAQIHRGIRLLRRMLPTGFALGGYAGTEAGLEAVRARVLEDGARHIGLGADALADLAARNTARALRRKATLVGALGALGVVLWLAWPASADPGATPTLVAGSATSEPARELDLEQDSSRFERASLAIEAEPSSVAGVVEEYGSLVVKVREDDVDAPVVGARVSVIAWGSTRWFENVRDARTDQTGVARFERVHAGRVGVYVERGDQFRGDIVANQQTSIVVRSPRTIALDVVVTESSGRPIAGALVDVHARRDEPPVLTSAPTDALGRVRIERAPNECFVAARADGRVTSNMAWSGVRTANDGPARFTIELARGGLLLEGLVVGDRGATIAGARVCVSSALTAEAPTWRSDGTPTFETAPVETRTDANGCFRFDGLNRNAVRLRVESAGRATHVARVEPTGGRFGLETVHLGPSATLRGVTRSEDGSIAPHAQVEVVVGGEQVLETHSGVDGSYVLDLLPCGRVVANARAGAYGSLTTLELVLGRDGPSEWNPTLSGGETIQGRVIGQDGRALSTGLVLATSEEPAADPALRLAQWARAQMPAPVDDLVLQNRISPTGMFVVPCRSAATHRIELRGRNAWRESPQAWLGGVRPGARDVVLPVSQARGRIDGRFVDARGRPTAMTRVIAVSSGATGELVGTIDASTSRFSIATLDDTFELLAWSPAGAIHNLGTVEMRKPRIVDLGDRVVEECGEIVITAMEGASRPLELLGASGLRFELVPLDERMWRAKGLQPGVYTLRTQSAAGKVGDERLNLGAGSVVRFTCPEN